MKKITDNVYYFMNDDELERPCIGVVKGSEGCLLIDAANSPSHAHYIMNELKKAGFPPVKYVVCTHYHWDHTFGLKEWNAIKISGKKTFQHMKATYLKCYDEQSILDAVEKGVLSEPSIAKIKKEIPNLESFSPVFPELVFEGSMEINLGNITCQLSEITSPHTTDSVVIFIPEEKVLFLGDSAYSTSVDNKPYFKRNETLAMIEAVEHFDAENYICAHESLCTKEEMTDYLTQLKQAEQITRDETNFERAISSFTTHFNKEPNADDEFYIKAFMPAINI